MTSRTDMDRPATILSASLGVVLIAVSILLFVFVGGSTATTYEVAWDETEAGTSQGNLAVGSQATVVRVPVTDALPSNATIVITCNDGATPPLQNAATYSWKLFEGNNTTPLAQGTTCTSPSGQKIDLGSHPDVGSIKADSSTEAEEEAAGDDLKTTEYRLEVTVSRAAAPGGLPLPAPAFTGTAKLTVEEWLATANAPGQEATR